MKLLSNQKSSTAHIKKMFFKRRYTYYQSTLLNVKGILKYWGIFIYVLIGFIAGFGLLFSIQYNQNILLYGEVLLIYVSTLYFLISTQFSIKYFLHPADRIHFAQHSHIILKLRKYAVIHGTFLHIINWLLVYILLSPLYFTIFPCGFDYYISLFIFSVSFSLVTSIIRKESMFHLCERHGVLYKFIYGVLTVVMQVWFTIIFCFADLLYIFIGTVINVLIFFYSYRWGTHIVLPTLNYLILHDTRKNIIYGAISGKLSKQQNSIRPHRIKPYILNFSNGFLKENKKQFVLLSLLIKHLLKTTSYKVMMVYLFAASVIGLLVIEFYYQFIILAIVTLYMSFLIHKQHIEYFFAHTVMETNVQQGFNKRHFDITCTLVTTMPCIIIMLLIYSFI